MTAKEEYRILCEDTSLHIPLFQQHWWMEAVCVGKRWDVLLARDKEGVIQAALPYLIGSKLGLRYILQPQLTQYNGIWYRKHADEFPSERHRLQYEERMATAILEQLEQLHTVYYQQTFAPGIGNWMPFFHAGYKQTTRYTYRLEHLADTDAIWNGMSRNERQRRIEHLLPKTRLEPMSAEQFAQFQSHCRAARGERNLLPSALVEGVCATALQRGQGLCHGLRDEAGTLMAALFVPYDRRCAYYLIPAVLPEYERVGAMDTLIWLTLQKLSSQCRSFDFEGSMIRGIEQYYQSFGAVQTPLLRISRCKPINAFRR